MAISGIPSVTAVDELVAIYLSEINWYVIDDEDLVQILSYQFHIGCMV